MERGRVRANPSWPILVAAIVGLLAIGIDQVARIETLQVGRVSLAAFGFLYLVVILVNEVTALECRPDCLPRFRFYSYSLSIPVLGFLGWMCWKTAPAFLAIPWPIIAVGVSAAVIFVASAVTCAAPDRKTLTNLAYDLVKGLRQPVTIAAGAALFAVGMWSTTLFERHGPMGKDFEQWFVSQERRSLPTGLSRAPVTIVEFRDQMSPRWRSAHSYYRKYLDGLASSAVEVVTLDFPMDPTCNSAIVNAANSVGCTAAAAMRVAAGHGMAEVFQSWLADQSPISEDAIMTKLHALLGNVQDAEFARASNAVEQDIEIGQLLGITAVPAYVINGVRVGFVPLVNFQVAVAHELHAANITETPHR